MCERVFVSVLGGGFVSVPVSISVCVCACVRARARVRVCICAPVVRQRVMLDTCCAKSADIGQARARVCARVVQHVHARVVRGRAVRQMPERWRLPGGRQAPSLPESPPPSVALFFALCFCPTQNSGMWAHAY